MKRALLILLCIFSISNVSAYEPKEYNFKNRYQYQMFLSWIQCGYFRKNAKAAINSEYIKMEFSNRFNQTAKVYFSLDDYKIHRQREIIPLPNDQKKQFETIHILTEEIIYRLNCREPDYIYDFINQSNLRIEYDLGENKKAIYNLWKAKEYSRFTVLHVRYSVKNNDLVATIETSLDTLFLHFPKDAKTKDIIEKLSVVEKTKQKRNKTSSNPPQKKDTFQKGDFLKGLEPATKKQPIISNPKKQKPIKIKPLHPQENTHIEPSFIPNLFKGNTDITNFIASNMNRIPNHRLIQTQIKNPIQFLKKEKRNHKLSLSDPKAKLTIKPINENIYGDLFLSFKQTEDAVYFYPSLEYKTQNNKVILPNGEEISFLNMNGIEIQRTMPTILSQIAIHRSLGSDLFWTLSEQDYAQTIVSIHDQERLRFSFHTYAELQRLLQKYWTNKTVYFSVNEVRKIKDGYEFKSYLLAETDSPSNYDYAEVRFHMNEHYILDLVMLILHPQISI